MGSDAWCDGFGDVPPTEIIVRTHILFEPTRDSNGNGSVTGRGANSTLALRTQDYDHDEMRIAAMKD